MKTLLIGILILILFTGGFLLRRQYIKWKYQKLLMQKYDIVQPLINKLASKEVITEREVFVMAQDPALRHVVYRALEAYKQENLFPAEYLTTVKAAESFLVMWLEFPTELGKPPDEIELFTTITLPEEKEMEYFVFKYRIKGTRQSGQDWMMGVAGPYSGESRPYTIPRRIFSRFNTVASISAEQEVRWVHEHINPG